MSSEVYQKPQIPTHILHVHARKHAAEDGCAKALEEDNNIRDLDRDGQKEGRE